MRTTILSLVLRVILLYLVLALAYSLKAKADQLIKIGIIDTGYNFDYANAIGATPLKLCDKGHYDFLTNKPILGHAPTSYLHNRGNHGTVVASIIAEKLKDVNYCAVIIQLFNMSEYSTYDVMNARLAKAFTRLQQQNVIAINYSISGLTILSKEWLAMKKFTARGGSVFVAAGNERLDFNINCLVYPACYLMANEYVIGALDGLSKCPVTNTGSLIYYYDGNVPKSLKLEDKCATSYAVPKAFSEFILSFSRFLHGDYQQVPMQQAKTQ